MADSSARGVSQQNFRKVIQVFIRSKPRGHSFVQVASSHRQQVPLCLLQPKEQGECDGQRQSICAWVGTSKRPHHGGHLSRQ